MPFALLFIAILAIAIGARGQANAAGQLLASEFTGSNSFIQWFLAVLIVGSVGFYKPAAPVSRAGLGLILVAVFLKKGNGFFADLENAFQTATATAANSVAPSQGAAQGGSSATAPVPGPAGTNAAGDALFTDPFAGASSTSSVGSDISQFYKY